MRTHVSIAYVLFAPLTRPGEQPPIGFHEIPCRVMPSQFCLDATARQDAHRPPALWIICELG